jgi:hypothetical protein
MWTKASSPEIDPEVFVWQEIPPVPHLNEAAYQPNERGHYELFSHIASYTDLVVSPVDVPDTDFSPFFRKRYLDLTSENKAILDETLTLALAQIHNTTREVYRLLNLPPAEVIEEQLG